MTSAIIASDVVGIFLSSAEDSKVYLCLVILGAIDASGRERRERARSVFRLFIYNNLT